MNILTPNLFLKNFYFPMVLAMLSTLMVSCANTKEKEEVIVKSPDGRYTLNFRIDTKSLPTYNIRFMDKEIIGTSGLGFEMGEGHNAKGDIHIEGVETNEVRATWKPVYGEKNEYPEKYHESLIILKGEGAFYNIRIRAYDEGLAFRYEFHNAKGNITQEVTEFSLPPSATAWASLRAQSAIEEIQVSQLDSVVERPLLIQLDPSLFTAIGEAALVDYARMKLTNSSDRPGTLVSQLSSEVVLGSGVNKTPWRFVMAGESAGEILENNYLLLNLNEPNKLKNTSWIKPGKVIRETTLTTQGGIACIDFAVKHNLQFIEFDAGWYGNEYDDKSDATTITVDPKRSKGPLDLLSVIKYARSKDIGVILYVNRRALEKQLDEVLPLLKSWGVSGIKYGFVNVGPQEWTSWLHDAIRKAADHGLMIDVHDEYRPTGYSRTYPNFMTQEGIRGDEESPDNSMVIKTLFTRMIAGAGDHTNCYFAPRVDEKMGSHASQLAKAVCVYSPWQFLYWYDRPQGSKPEEEGAGGSKEFIQEVPELKFFDELPTVWDDTKVIGGYPGEYAIMARKSGDDWFVGALNGADERMISIPFDFLNDDKTYEATIYTDDAGSTSVTKVSLKNRKIVASDTVDFKLLVKNGLAIHLKLAK